MKSERRESEKSTKKKPNYQKSAFVGDGHERRAIKKDQKISQPNDALLSAKRREKEKKEGIQGKKRGIFVLKFANEKFYLSFQTLLWKVTYNNNNNKHGA